jgi:hypothetical protein
VFGCACLCSRAPAVPPVACVSVSYMRSPPSHLVLDWQHHGLDQLLDLLVEGAGRLVVGWLSVGWMAVGWMAMGWLATGWRLVGWSGVQSLAVTAAADASQSRCTAAVNLGLRPPSLPHPLHTQHTHYTRALHTHALHKHALTRIRKARPPACPARRCPSSPPSASRPPPSP